MRFILNLHTTLKNAMLPANYQYPLSAAIYKIISRADEAYAAFLHDQGYQAKNRLKTFKLFTFSDIRTPFKMEGDRMRLLKPEAEVLISFHLPQTAETFIKGLFISQEIEIADKKSRIQFRINRVESVSTGLTEESFQEIILQPISPLVCGQKNERGHYDFLSPQDQDFSKHLTYSWMEKYRTAYPDASRQFTQKDIQIRVIPYKNKPPKSRLMAIKQSTPEETKIRGFKNFRLEIKAPKPLLELALNAGLGQYSSIGMGCMEVVPVK